MLEELGLTYESVYLDFQKGEHKAPEHTQYNPNGRIPSLIDHKNNNFAIWESCAIIKYLVDKYDTGNVISAVTLEDKATELQWLFFQASGQGPYYGQAAWFVLFHPEKIPSAQERYKKEIIRVLGVLESVLSKQTWLLGDKLTISDLSFIPWNDFAFRALLPEGTDVPAQFPAVDKWHKTMALRPSVTKIHADQEALKK